MKYRALVSFTGLVSMGFGEVREISDQSIADGLLKARLIEPVEEEQKAEKTTTKKTKSRKEKKE